MLFNSLEFFLFLPIVFALYWGVSDSGRQSQNVVLLLASYVFYGWWDWRFLSLIVLSTIVDFVAARKIEHSESAHLRKTWLAISIVTNLGVLGFFKYANFFIDNFQSALAGVGIDTSPVALSIILPVGISFYTFQTMSYSIDVYRRKIKSTPDLLGFACYVSFFPQLVAGPIEKAAALLPQFQVRRHFDYHLGIDGLRQMAWGLFQKVVIADNCAPFVNAMFDNPEGFQGSSLLIGALLFSFQIYGDFAGYSNIAIGTAKLFGVRLRDNFAYPYFSRDIAEFWRRWHISLTSWFKEYLYIPLGGSRGKTVHILRNICIVFLVSGFWHGANWTFIIWGLIHFLLYIPLLLQGRNRRHVGEGMQASAVLHIILTFSIVTLAWIFFRAENVPAATHYLGAMFKSSLFEVPNFYNMGKALTTIFLIVVMLIFEWKGRVFSHPLVAIDQVENRAVRWIFYGSLVSVIILFAQTTEQPFIYFQF